MTLQTPKFLIREVEDAYSQENWYKLKKYLDQLEANIATTVNQTINVGGTGPWVTGSKTVLAATTEVLDRIPLTNFHCAEYTICMKNASGTLTRTLKVLVRKDDSDIKDTIFAKNGDNIDIEINSVQIGPDFELQIVNNEAFSMDLSFARLEL